MFLNIMYYQTLNETKTNNSTNTVGLSVGPLYVSAQQVEFLCFHCLLNSFVSVEDYYWNYCGSLRVHSKYFISSILSTNSNTWNTSISSTSSSDFFETSTFEVNRILNAAIFVKKDFFFYSVSKRENERWN